MDQSSVIWNKFNKINMPFSYSVVCGVFFSFLFQEKVNSHVSSYFKPGIFVEVTVFLKFLHL